MIIESSASTYPIKIVDHDKENMNALLTAWIQSKANVRRVMIVTDTLVYKHYNQNLVNLTESLVGLQTHIHLVPNGESSKSILEAEKLWSNLAENGFGRNDLLIAYGGGMVGDLTGFCASTYLRGIDFIQVPTTLLSQIDSSIGGKVAVNLSAGKNLVGQFYNPIMVIIDSAFLLTLSDKELASGLGELIKYGLMGLDDLLSWLDQFSSLSDIKAQIEHEPLKFNKTLETCLVIKKTVVEVDFKEKGIRKYLNLGHTIGHGIEQWSTYRFTHGHCVVLGCWWILNLAIRELSAAGLPNDHLRGKLSLIEGFMHRFELPLTLDYPIEDILTFVQIDKKKNAEGIQFVWIKNENSPVASQTGPILSQGLSIPNEAAVLELLENHLFIKLISIEELRSAMNDFMKNRNGRVENL